jgi:signal transduction histidine kinase
LRSLRMRLFLILALLVAAAFACGLIMLALFQQSATAQIGQATAEVGHACDAIGRAYRFYTTGWPESRPDFGAPELRRGLNAVSITALRDKPGIEGGIWQAEVGPLAYGFPTYEGAGPKTDIPQAELSRITSANQLAEKDDRPRVVRFDSGAQTLLIASCPLPGPISGLTGWTMTRVHSLGGPAYGRLVAGLAILVLAVAGAGGMAAALIMTWSKHVERIVTELAAQKGELPQLALTGERELDNIVRALNDAGQRLSAFRETTEKLAGQVASGERLAAVGRVAAGVAHEIRNPIAAMRLAAELALNKADRREQTLRLVISQVDRLDLLVQRLLTASEREPLRLQSVSLAPFLETCAELHRDEAAAKGVTIVTSTEVEKGCFDPDQMSRALNNLLVNAVQEGGSGPVRVEARSREGELVLSVSDRGAGPPAAIQDHLFDPFVSGKPDRTGLGLAIVREIAAAHGGRAEFERLEGETIFQIVTPWQKS